MLKWINRPWTQSCYSLFTAEQEVIRSGLNAFVVSSVSEETRCRRIYMVEMQITALGAFSLFKQLKMRPGVTCGSAEDGKSLFSPWMLQSALRWMNEFGSQTASDGKLYEHISPKCPIEAVKLWDWTRRSHSLWDEIMILQNTLIFSNSLLTKEAGWLTLRLDPYFHSLSLTLWWPVLSVSDGSPVKPWAKREVFSPCLRGRKREGWRCLSGRNWDKSLFFTAGEGGRFRTWSFVMRYIKKKAEIVKQSVELPLVIFSFVV